MDWIVFTISVALSCWPLLGLASPKRGVFAYFFIFAVWMADLAFLIGRAYCRRERALEDPRDV